MKKEKRIPTILGLLLLIASTIAGAYLTTSARIFTQKASGDCTPDSVQVTNISHNTASIYFLTSAQCSAQVKINGRNLNDYRTSSLNYSPSTDKLKTHYFQIEGLKEATIYKYEIISGGQSYTQTSYQLKTASKPAGTLPVSNLAWGKAYDQSSKPAFGAIIFVNIPGASPLSSVVTSSGNWNISLATSFDISLQNWFTPGQNIDEEIIVVAENLSQPTVLMGNTSRNNPVPDIILGQDYFSTPSDSDSNSPNYFSNLTPTSTQKSLTVTYPKQNETINSLKPEFIGTAPNGSTLTAKLSNNTQSYQIITDSIGNWKWTPPQGLLPGANTITISSGTDIITRNFLVDAGGGLAFEASNSATTPTQIPTMTPTIAAISPTIAPTTIPSPTSIPATPTTIRTQKPSTESGVPRPGAGTFTLLILLISISFIIFSLQLIKKSDNFK